MCRFIFFIFSLIFVVDLQAQVHGRLVNSDEEAVIAANIVLTNMQDKEQYYTSSDLDGFFQVDSLSLGEYGIEISYVGSEKLKFNCTVDRESVDLGILRLKDEVNISEVLVGDRDMNFFSTSRVASTVAMKTIVNPEQLKDVFAPTNLVEAVSLVSGVQEEIACGVCFTNTLSINGLAGQYSAILIDGTPMYGNLASVYGLNGIPTTMIDRIEVTKGPSSTVFGSEAIAGVINIITKDPKTAPLLSIDLMGTSHLESFNNVSLSLNKGRFNSLIGVSHAFANTYIDGNNDGFGDIIGMDRVAAFAKIKLDRPQNKRFNIFAKYYYEDRRNGVEAYLKNRAYKTLRGDDEIYGESIYTKRWELVGTYDFPGKEYFNVDFSFSGHDQDSYYGSDHYVAEQYIAFSNWNWNKYINGHGITTGLTLRYQYYDDNTVATEELINGQLNSRASQQFIPGIFVQDAWDINQKWTMLAGCRLDYQQNHGLITSPRFNVKYKPTTWSTLRLNLGTGFRVVNLFTEDHAFVTGNRAVVLSEEINPERSYNLTLNYNQVFSIGNSQGFFDVDLFYTYFTNAIFPDYTESDKIIYSNLNGYAQTRGVNLSYNQQFSFPLTLNINFNAQYASQTEKDSDGKKQESALEYAPFYSGNLMLNYRIPKWDLSFSYTVGLTGSMYVPEVFDVNTTTGDLESAARPVLTKAFSMQNFQINKKFSKINLELYGGIKNLLNYRQPFSPLAGYNDPNASAGFSDYFDTAYAYSPIHGREFYLGLRWRMLKK